MSTKIPLGKILCDEFGLSEERLNEALGMQREKGRRLGETLLNLKYISEEDLSRALGIQFEMPFVEELTSEIDTELIIRIPIHFAKQNSIIPLNQEDRFVTVAVSDPSNISAIDDLRNVFEMPIKTVVSSSKEILDTINRVYDRASTAAEQVIDGLEDSDLGSIAEGLKEPEDLLDVTDEAPIIRLLNSLMFQAVKERASDIHIEPFEKELSIRFRIDGILYNIINTPKRLQPSVISRVKVIAGLDIAEKRLPQDGRIRIKIAGRDIDIRVSVVPTAFGERVVMRLLDKTSILFGLEEIGLSHEHLEQMNRLIHRSNGIILVTGPTGSGKTTTLYGALSRINSPDKNIITVEDPIEYQLKGIGQIQVNPKINLTFANGLRSILRQDPDVILVGEIRDVETAEIAIQASLTGHLVFSTLHTNDASGAITRLLDMGVEPFLVSSSVIGILAQRLIRVTCDHCKTPYEPREEELKEIEISPDQLEDGRLFKGKGCDKCMNTGYMGRTGLFEFIVVGDSVRSRIMEGVDSATIKKIALSLGMLPLKSDGTRKVMAGITTIEEVMRVTQEDVVD